MVKKLKIMPDYGCFALWDIDTADNIDPGSLPLSDDLKERIGRWEDAYDSTLNQDDPTASCFESPDEENAFDIEGISIWEEMNNELGESYDVRYFSVVENALI